MIWPNYKDHLPASPVALALRAKAHLTEAIVKALDELGASCPRLVEENEENWKHYEAALWAGK